MKDIWGNLPFEAVVVSIRCLLFLYLTTGNKEMR